MGDLDLRLVWQWRAILCGVWMEETGLNDSLQQRGWASFEIEASAGPSNAFARGA